MSNKYLTHTEWLQQVEDMMKTIHPNATVEKSLANSSPQAVALFRIAEVLDQVVVQLNQTNSLALMEQLNKE